MYAEFLDLTDLLHLEKSIMLIHHLHYSTTDIEAESSREQLHDLVQKLLQSNHDISKRLHQLEVTIDSESILTTCFRNNRGIEDEHSTTDIIRKGANSEQFESDDSFAVFRTEKFQFSFEADLGSSRVYKRTQPFTSDVSFASSAVRSHAWSIFSGLSLSQVSSMSAIALPVHTDEIYNYANYQIGHLSPLDNGSMAMGSTFAQYHVGGKTYTTKYERYGLLTTIERSNPHQQKEEPPLAKPINNMESPELSVSRRRYLSKTEYFPPAFSRPKSPDSVYSFASSVEIVRYKAWPLPEIDSSRISLPGVTAPDSSLGALVSSLRLQKNTLNLSDSPVSSSVLATPTLASPQREINNTEVKLGSTARESVSSSSYPEAFLGGSPPPETVEATVEAPLDVVPVINTPIESTSTNVTLTVQAETPAIIQLPLSRSLNSLPLGHRKTSFKIVILGESYVGKTTLSAQVLLPFPLSWSTFN